MYETQMKSNSRTLTLIEEVGSLARGRMRLLPNQESAPEIPSEEKCLRALHSSISKHGYNTVNVLCEVVKLAEVYASKTRLDDFEKAFNEAERIYMSLTSEPEPEKILDALIDLGWQLSIKGCAKEAHRVNNLVAFMKALDGDATAEC